VRFSHGGVRFAVSGHIKQFPSKARSRARKARLSILAHAASLWQNLAGRKLRGHRRFCSNSYAKGSAFGVGLDFAIDG
jgi:hypothetical protein